MCLNAKTSALKEFKAKWGQSGFVEVYKYADLIDGHVVAPYRSTAYPLHIQNFISSSVPFSKSRVDDYCKSPTYEVSTGAVHVYLNRAHARHVWEYNIQHDRGILLRCWAPLHEMYGVSPFHEEGAFSHIIVDAASMTKLYKKMEWGEFTYEAIDRLGEEL